jgi:3-oxoisoapionate kinase
LKNLAANKKILLAFYGDDFTGSTDALEFICRAGAKAVLFIEPPTTEQLKQYPDLDAYGVAGKTRSLPPEEMEKILLPAFEQMKTTGAKHVHYKVCSTFDSSPAIGSIGKAIDCGALVFKNKVIPVLGGMPALGRFCVFGNLFAKMGTGGEGKIYRLDRHPSMSKHPVTPADESDLRLHLGKQTNKKIGLIDIVELTKPVDEIDSNEDVVLIDALNEQHLLKIGRWIDELSEHKTQFSVGGSGIEVALGNYWDEKRLLKQQTDWPKIDNADPLLVLSGSCSPVTKKQIAYALSKDFVEIPLGMKTFEGEDGHGFTIEENFEEILLALRQKQNVIVHTGNIEQIEQSTSAHVLGTILGRTAKEICRQVKIKRIVIAGGDTSSYAARAMEIEAVEMIAPIVIGAPLCKAISKNRSINGLEVNFKGGQVGSENYFEVLLNGTI